MLKTCRKTLGDLRDLFLLSRHDFRDPHRFLAVHMVVNRAVRVSQGLKIPDRPSDDRPVRGMTGVTVPVLRMLADAYNSYK
jgi:hypothetical protein